MIKIRLSSILGDYRMTQKELAQKTGIRPATINAMFHESISEISKKNLDKICDVLDCAVEDILEHIPNDRLKRNN